jgi:Major Facilitator Superfamily
MTGMTRQRDLRIVAGAIAVSAIGDWVAMIALGLRANQMWEGGGVAVFLICLWSPLALLAGHVGVLVDRVETRALAIWSAAFQAVVAVALAFAGSLAEILPLAVLLGVGVAVSGAAEFALIPLIAGSREIGRANGFVESMRGIGFVAGPAIGGLVAGGAGTRYAMLADACTFLLIGAVLATLPVRRRAVAEHGASPRARDGLTVLFSDRILAIGLGAGAVTLVFMSASIPADFSYAKNVLGVGDFAFGCVLTAWAVGMVVAANVIPRRIPVAAVASVTLVAAVLQGLAKFAAPFWLSYPFMVVCWSVGGMGHGVKNTGFRTLIHTRVAPERHGRAFAAFNGMRNTAELVALAGGGALVATLGGRGTLWIAGGISALAAVVGIAALSPSRAKAELPQPALD